MIKEVTHQDVPEVKASVHDGFKDIKPEKEMSANEINDAIKGEFDKAAGEVLTYQDDNGVKYREGDRLLPNIEFEKNGYKYKTDDQGRVISAEGKLQVRDHEGRREMDPRSSVDKGDMRDTDDRGHLIADRFNGSGGIENLVPMDSKLNQGDYAKLENTLADAVKDGADVRMKVEPVYNEGAGRPSEFRVSYSIDGEREVVVFKNESEAKS